MAVLDFSDIYMIMVGMVYPAYNMLKERDQPESQTYWYKYWSVFALGYATSELLESFLYIVIPFVTLFQMVGVSVLVGTKCSPSIYESYIIPWFEKFMSENSEITEIVETKYQYYVGSISKLWRRFVPIKISYYHQE